MVDTTDLKSVGRNGRVSSSLTSATKLQGEITIGASLQVQLNRIILIIEDYIGDLPDTYTTDYTINEDGMMRLVFTFNPHCRLLQVYDKLKESEDGNTWVVREVKKSTHSITMFVWEDIEYEELTNGYQGTAT